MKFDNVIKILKYTVPVFLLFLFTFIFLLQILYRVRIDCGNAKAPQILGLVPFLPPWTRKVENYLIFDTCYFADSRNPTWAACIVRDLFKDILHHCLL